MVPIITGSRSFLVGDAKSRQPFQRGMFSFDVKSRHGLLQLIPLVLHIMSMQRGSKRGSNESLSNWTLEQKIFDAPIL